MKQNNKIVFFMGLWIFLSFHIFPQDNTTPVIARINGQIITQKDLQQKMRETINKMYVHGNLPPEKAAEIKKQAIEILVLEELFYQEAKKQGIKTDKKELKTRFNKIVKNFKSRSKFKKALRSSGISSEDLKNNLKREFLIREVYKINVLEKVNITGEDLYEYYSANKKRFFKPESINLQHILVKINDVASNTAWQEAYKKAEDLVLRLNSGEDFADLAGRYSNDRYRIKGGHLGEIHRGVLVSEVEKVAFSLEKGEISPPVKSIYGYHIIKLLEKREARQLDFKDIVVKLEKDLKEKYENEAKKKWIAGLKARAEIEIFQNPR